MTDAQIDNADRFQRFRLRSLRAVEDMIEAVLQALAETGRLERTYIVFTSDNGLLMGQHRAVGRKGNAYEESIGIPLIVRGPGVLVGRTDAIALTIDLAPTLLDLAGVPIPESVDGRSLAPFLRGTPPASWRTDALVENHGAGPSYSLRTAEWMYNHQDTEEFELYDMRNDPYQLQNLYRTADPALLDSLRKRWRPSSPAAAPPAAADRKERTRDHRLRLQRNPAGPSARERAGQGLRARVAGEGRAQGAPRGDGRGADRDPARDRRPGGPQRRDREGGDAARPRPRPRRLAQGHEGARRAGDRGRRRGPPRVGELALGGPGRGLPPGGGPARDDLARHAQRRDHARPVEDRLPGGDRLRGRARRLLALQPALRAGALRRAAALQLHDVEPARLPGRSRASCTR